MLSYKSRTSGRKGLRGARIFVMKETFFHGTFFGAAVLRRSSHPVLGRWILPSYFPLQQAGCGCSRGLSDGGRREGRMRLGSPQWPVPPGNVCCLPQVTAVQAAQDIATAGHGANHILLYYTKLFVLSLSMKAGFCGYEWILPCALCFRLVGKKKHECCIHLEAGLGIFFGAVLFLFPQASI